MNNVLLATKGSQADISVELAALFAKIFNVYLNSDPEVQQVVRDMVKVAYDKETDSDEQFSAIVTVAEALSLRVRI